MISGIDKNPFAPHASDGAFAQAALALASRGLFVIPCDEKKHPRGVKNGHLSATTDPDVIRAWDARSPDANIGVACAMSGLVVIDIDDEDAWQRFLEENGIDEPETVVATTPSGGRHLYFRAKAGAIYPKILAPGVDVKSNGYVLAAPSVAYSKRAGREGSYVWQDGKHGFADAPDWLAKSDRKAAAGTPSLRHDVSLDELDELLGYIDPDVGYDQWRNVLMGLHDATGGSPAGLELAVDWSARGCKFKPGEVERIWGRFEPGAGISKGTIAWMAKTNGADLAAIAKKHDLKVYMTELRDDDGKEFRFEDLDLSNVEPLPYDRSSSRHDTKGRPTETTSGAKDPWGFLPAGLEDRTEIIMRAESLKSKGFRATEAEPLLKSAYLVKGLLLRSTVALMFGPSGAGKSFVALSIAQAIASGTPWNGRSVVQGTVVYVSSEGMASFRNRVFALGEDRSENLIVIPDQLDLFGGQIDAQALIAAIKQQTRDKPPVVLFVVDTLARSFGGGDENHAGDMGNVLQHVDLIRQALDATVLLVHHTGKDAERGARGSSSLRAAVETEIEVCVKEGAGRIRSTKQRDLDCAGEMHYDLDTVDLGVDEDGDPVTSCRVIFLDAEEAKSGRRKLSEVHKRALEAVMAAVADGGHDTKRTIPGAGVTYDVRVVKRDAAIEAVKATVDEKDPVKARRKANDLVKTLAKKGFLLLEGDEVSLSEATP